jgi:hypothetical protein
VDCRTRRDGDGERLPSLRHLAASLPINSGLDIAAVSKLIVGRIGQLEAQMGVDDAIARNLQLEGELVSRAISAGLDWLSDALDGETAVRVTSSSANTKPLRDASPSCIGAGDGWLCPIRSNLARTHGT